MANLKREVKKSRMQRLEARVNDLEKQTSRTRQQFAMFNKKIAEDLGLFDTRWRVSWEYFWGLVELLRSTNEDLYTESALESFREIVLDRWKLEAFKQQKEKLAVGQGICEGCHHIDGGPNFFDDDANERCPNCEKDTVNIHYNQVDTEDSDDVSVAGPTEEDTDDGGDSEEARI